MSAPDLDALGADFAAAVAVYGVGRVMAALLSAVGVPDGGPTPPRAGRGRERLPERPEALLTAAEVAERIGVSAEWVRDRRGEFGVLRVGDGPRPRLRFPVAAVEEWLTRRAGSGESSGAEPGSGPLLREGARPGRSGDPLDWLPRRELQPRRSTTKVAGRRANVPGRDGEGVTSPPPEPMRSGAAGRAPRKGAA